MSWPAASRRSARRDRSSGSCSSRTTGVALLGTATGTSVTLEQAALGLELLGVTRPDPEVRIRVEVTQLRVHILLGGRIVASGGRELADRLEGEGFDAFRTAEVGG